MIWAEHENGDEFSDKTFADVAELYRDRVTTMKKGRHNDHYNQSFTQRRLGQG